MKPLGTAHFRKPQRANITVLPEIPRLSSRLGEALESALSAIQPAPWRVIPDGVAREEEGGDGIEKQLLRYESSRGSLTALLGLDRQLVSAMLEVAMGGTGAEAAFEMSGRPLSKIEQRFLQVTYANIAADLLPALGDFLGRPFELFEDGESPDLDRSSEVVQFRFVANVFSYSGGIHLTFACDELEKQIAAVQAEGSVEAAPEASRKLQQEVGKSELTLTIALAEETLTLDALFGIHRGKLVPLTATAGTPVIVWSSGVAAYEADLGRSGDRFAITITSALS